MSYGVRKIMYHSTLRKHVKSLDDIQCGKITPLVRPTHVDKQIFGLYAEELVRRAICSYEIHKYTAEYTAVRNMQQYRHVCVGEYQKFFNHIEASRDYYSKYFEDLTKFHVPLMAAELHTNVLIHDVTKASSVIGIPDIVYSDTNGHYWVAEVKHAYKIDMSVFLQCYLYACLVQCVTCPVVSSDLGSPNSRRLAGMKVYDMMYGRIWTLRFGDKLPMSPEIARKELKCAVSAYRASLQK